MDDLYKNEEKLYEFLKIHLPSNVRSLIFKCSNEIENLRRKILIQQRAIHSFSLLSITRYPKKHIPEQSKLVEFIMNSSLQPLSANELPPDFIQDASIFIPQIYDNLDIFAKAVIHSTKNEYFDFIVNSSIPSLFGNFASEEYVKLASVFYTHIVGICTAELGIQILAPFFQSLPTFRFIECVMLQFSIHYGSEIRLRSIAKSINNKTEYNKSAHGISLQLLEYIKAFLPLIPSTHIVLLNLMKSLNWSQGHINYFFFHQFFIHEAKKWIESSPYAGNNDFFQQIIKDAFTLEEMTKITSSLTKVTSLYELPALCQTAGQSFLLLYTCPIDIVLISKMYLKMKQSSELDIYRKTLTLTQLNEKLHFKPFWIKIYPTSVGKSLMPSPNWNQSGRVQTDISKFLSSRHRSFPIFSSSKGLNCINYIDDYNSKRNQKNQSKQNNEKSINDLNKNNENDLNKNNENDLNKNNENDLNKNNENDLNKNNEKSINDLNKNNENDLNKNNENDLNKNNENDSNKNNENDLNKNNENNSNKYNRNNKSNEMCSINDSITDSDSKCNINYSSDNAINNNTIRNNDSFDANIDDVSNDSNFNLVGNDSPSYNSCNAIDSPDDKDSILKIKKSKKMVKSNSVQFAPQTFNDLSKTEITNFNSLYSTIERNKSINNLTVYDSIIQKNVYTSSLHTEEKEKFRRFALAKNIQSLLNDEEKFEKFFIFEAQLKILEENLLRDSCSLYNATFALVAVDKDYEFMTSRLKEIQVLSKIRPFLISIQHQFQNEFKMMSKRWKKFTEEIKERTTLFIYKDLPKQKLILFWECVEQLKTLVIVPLIFRFEVFNDVMRKIQFIKNKKEFIFNVLILANNEKLITSFSLFSSCLMKSDIFRNVLNDDLISMWAEFESTFLSYLSMAKDQELPIKFIGMQAMLEEAISPIWQSLKLELNKCDEIT